MSSTSIGRDAEDKVAQYLKTQGHKILAKNWRTRWCEIDLISTYQKTVYFTEVKFRSSTAWGDGLDYITDQKLRQMHFAAEFWIAEESWDGDACLQAASISADTIEVIEL